MALETHPLAAASAIAAAVSLLATPVAAAQLPRPAALKVYDAEAGNVDRNRRWHGHHGNDDVDVEDVIAGVLIFGAIAAIAGAASNNSRERQESYPDADYRPSSETGRFESRGIDRAVEICVAAVESGGERVGTVDAANRAAEGWQVSGELEQGAVYSCRIGDDGQVSDVSLDSTADEYGYDEASAEQVQKARYDETSYEQASAAAGDGGYETAQAPGF